MAEPTDEHPSQLRRNAISGPSGLAALNSSLEEHRRQLDGCSHEVNWGSADEFRPASRQASITPDPKRETENFARPASYSPRPYQWSTRETIIGESPVIADIRTNIIIHDEYTVLTDLSNELSRVYLRPETSIMVKIEHSMCMVLGGAFDPSYTLTISGIASLLTPEANKWNAILLAGILEEAIGVPASRGIIKFDPILEENLAWNHLTIAGQIETESLDGKSVKKEAKLGIWDSMISLRKSKTGNKKSSLKRAFSTGSAHKMKDFAIPLRSQSLNIQLPGRPLPHLPGRVPGSSSMPTSGDSTDITRVESSIDSSQLLIQENTEAREAEVRAGKPRQVERKMSFMSGIFRR